MGKCCGEVALERVLERSAVEKCCGKVLWRSSVGEACWR